MLMTVRRGSFRRFLALILVSTTAILGAIVVASPSDAASTPSASQTPLPGGVGFDGAIWTMRNLRGTTYIGGDFTHATYQGKSYSRTRLAAVDTATGRLLPWNPTADARVDAIATDPTDGYVYVGGRFHLINGIKRDTLAQITAVTGAVGPLNHRLTGHVDALAVGNGLLYAGGTTVKVDTTPRDHVEAFSLTTGALDPTWKPNADGNVRDILIDNTYRHRVYLGGKFQNINGAANTHFLAAVTPLTGAVDPSFNPHAPFWVRALVEGNGKIYAAIDGPGGLAIAYRLNGIAKWTYQFDGDPQALAYMRGVLYVGGHFDNACKLGSIVTRQCINDRHVPRVKLAAIGVRHGDLLAWDPQANGVVGTSGMSANKALGIVSVGGQFDLIGGKSVRRYAEFKQS